MNPIQVLQRTIELIRPELPDLVGEPWPGFEAQLAFYLPMLTEDAQLAAGAQTRLLALFSRHPRAYQRLVLAMVEQRIDSMQSTPRGVSLPKSGARFGPTTRYVDIACPRRVWIETPRLAVVVRLTLQPAAFGRTAETIALRTGAPVQVRIDAPDFELLSPASQEIPLPENQDSPPAVFDLRPKAVGLSGLTFDFYQAGEPAGTATVSIDVAQFEVAEATGPNPARLLRLNAESSPPDMVLTIISRPSPPALEFTLIRDGGAWIRTFPPVATTGPVQELSTELYRAMTSLVDTSDPTANAVLDKQRSIPVSEVDRRVKQLGQNLWRSLVPPELKQLYATERARWQGQSMLVLSDEPYLPWELLWPYDADGWEDDAPWCCSLRMTRWLRKDAQGNGNEKPPAQLKLKAWSVLAPTYSLLPELDGAQEERSILLAIAEQHGIADVSPPNPTWQGVMDLLERGGYDWLHAAAHGNFYAESPDTDTALWLEQDRALTPDAVVGAAIERHLRVQRPAFFFNACQVGRQGWALTRLGGWANRLISGGAGLFVAPLWEVSDRGALAFAQAFYTALLDGRTVAESTYTGRMAARQAGDPTWLAYSVYGHPNARVASG